MIYHLTREICSVVSFDRTSWRFLCPLEKSFIAGRFVSLQSKPEVHRSIFKPLAEKSQISTIQLRYDSSIVTIKTHGSSREEAFE